MCVSLLEPALLEQLTAKHGLLLVSMICALIAVAYNLTKTKSLVAANGKQKKTGYQFATKTDFPPVIKPIGDDWRYENAESIPFRPFAGKKDFKINMGIKNLSKDPEEFILIEKTHKERTNLRKKLCEQHFDKILNVVEDEDRVVFAVREYYEKVTQFLLDRYPHYFKIINDPTKTPSKQIYNSISDEYMPLDGSNIPPKLLLQHIGANIEEDVFILLKNDPTNPDEEYHLKANYNAFPGGFNAPRAFNQAISVVHAPIPQYRERLQLSMTRFFNRLEPQHMWYRTNWSIQMHDQIYNPDDLLNHGRPGMRIVPLKYEEVDWENKAFLRCERQVFTRMPKSRANIMLIRTYLTPIKQIKEEGLGEELLRAIDGMPEDLGYYKKRDYWGDAIRQFLQT